MEKEKARGKRGRARGRARHDAASRRPGDEEEVRLSCLPIFGLGFHGNENIFMGFNSLESFVKRMIERCCLWPSEQNYKPVQIYCIFSFFFRDNVDTPIVKKLTGEVSFTMR